MKRAALLMAMLLAGAAPVAAQAPDGAALYKRCAACHLPSGAGVPGAFPPLQTDFMALARKLAGRRYLALVVIKGIAGPLTIDGKAYRSAMPAQSMLDDARIAAVLNHVGRTNAKAGSGFRAFTTAEVAAARKSGEGLTAANVGALRATLGGK